MPCNRVNWGGTHGVLCTTPVFEYEGFLFEWHSFCGPMSIRRDNGEERERIPRGFWDAMKKFGELSTKEREPFRITGR